MWRRISWLWLLTSTLARSIVNNNTIFRAEHVIFTSNYNITRLLVTIDDSKYEHTKSSELPSIFFTVSDPKLKGGSCIYVFKGLEAYEVLEGGRDSTIGNGGDKNIYFGAKDGFYKYNPEKCSAEKIGNFSDDIIQIQKASKIDAIYALNADHKILKIENNATRKSRIEAINCALEFVLDTSNNIYYISCEDHMLHIVKADGSLTSLTASVIEDFKSIKLLRPSFLMEDCVPFFGNGGLYVLHANGTSVKKDFYIKEEPSAFSVDAGIYLVAALNGKIYEFNIIEILLNSLFIDDNAWPNDLMRIVMPGMNSGKPNIHGYIVE